jgi:2,3-bisphosphoglycerate-dependent phosphoglycerate mutase
LKNLLAFWILFFISTSYAQPTIYIVRHSEKFNQWPDSLKSFAPLNEKGIETSQKLADYFKDKKLAAIYSSEFNRTLHTAIYASKEKSVSITVNEACSDTSKISRFLSSLENQFDNDESVLIVSHSNIIPYFLIKLGLSKNEYDDMSFTKSKSGWLLTDYYGEIFIINEDRSINRERFTN